MTIEIIECFILYASGLMSGLAIELMVIWIMMHTGHDVTELWDERRNNNEN